MGLLGVVSVFWRCSRKWKFGGLNFEEGLFNPNP